MAGVLGEYTEVFLEESEDQIEELNANLLKLEEDHTNKEIINDIFRAAHSLKSSAAFVGLFNLSDLAHKMENLLQKIREGSLEINLTLVNLLFESFDLIKGVIEAVSRGEKVETPFPEMISKLDEYEKNPNSSGSAVTTPSTSSTKSPSASPQTSSNFVLESDSIQGLEKDLKSNPGWNIFHVRVKIKDDTPMKGLRFLLVLQSLKSNGNIYQQSPSEEELDNGTSSSILEFVMVSGSSKETITTSCNIDMVEDLLVEDLQLPSSQEKKTPQLHSNKEESEGNEPKQGDGKAVVKSIKVSSDKLDSLMNNVGELVITNSGFQKIYEDLVSTFGEDSIFNELKLKIDQINRISKELQNGIMNIRMVPIGSVFNRFSRLVRDLALETGKKIHLELKGESTELDKKVIDAIGEPIIHLIRNSADHGIESPEDRERLGKPEVGYIELNAYQGGSNIMVEIKDDGRGLNKGKILEKAIKNGLVTKEESQSLSDNEIYNFIFSAGFSTADQITDISGRGVGMNVVNKLIEEFKGKILIQTREGQGTTFTLSFPQALAIIPSILVTMEEEVYAFPLSEVSETIKVSLDQITTLEGHEIINLRGEVLPIFRLNRIIGLSDRKNITEIPIIIVNYKTRKLGFTVDDLIGKHETVIKSLSKNYKNVPGLTGATITGDGTIILVLDIPGLVDLAMEKDFDETKQVAMAEMPKVSLIRSLESNDLPVMEKTGIPTNLFNSTLHEIRSKDKARKHKEKKREESLQKSKVRTNGVYTRETSPENEIEDEMPVVRQAKTQKQPVVKRRDQKSRENLSPIPEDIHLDIVEEDTQEVVPDLFSETIQMKPGEEMGSNGFIPEKEEEDHEEKIEALEMDSESVALMDHIAEKINIDSSDKEKAQEIIKSFIDQKNSRMTVQTSDEKIQEQITPHDLRKLEGIMNTGMMNSGVVLSQLVKKEIELFIPEIKVTDKDTIIKTAYYADDEFYSLRIRMNGDLKGSLLMLFSRDNAIEIMRELLHEEIAEDGVLTDDQKSVLAEISNIVCAGVINSLSNKTHSQILPSVPEFSVTTFQKALEQVKPGDNEFLTMHTEFNHQGNNLIGILLFLPDFEQLLELISEV
jgi:two-component system chemotaxis sensor kinase CheA